jgi:outer membrane protein assembly factor BamB
MVSASVFVLLSSVVAAQLNSGAWLSPGGDADRTGQSQFDTASVLYKAWEYPYPAVAFMQGYPSPAIDSSGRLFVTGGGGVYAHNSTTGDVIWNFIDGICRTSPILDSAGRVFVYGE